MAERFLLKSWRRRSSSDCCLLLPFGAMVRADLLPAALLISAGSKYTDTSVSGGEEGRVSTIPEMRSFFFV